MTAAAQCSILILDFGSQYTQLIARRIRELGVYCLIKPYNLSQQEFALLTPLGVILSGGPASVHDTIHCRAPSWIFDQAIPILGICYGMQTMAAQLGGGVQTSQHCEFGYAELHCLDNNKLLHGLADHITDQGRPCLDVWMSHGDQVTQLPADFIVIAQTQNTPIAAIAHTSKPWYGVQFHPEVTHTKQGVALLRRFVFTICGAVKNWSVQQIAADIINSCKEQIGQEQVLLALSGGVDSSVVAALLHRAIGSQLICVFVDTGLLRLGEIEQVRQLFASLSISIHYVNAQEQFLTALTGVDCPETKRKIIGHVFIEVFAAQAQQWPLVTWLAQGTIYPDIIESAGSSATQASATIKSHHNVGGLPEILPLKLLEPIRYLFKDEVRNLGLQLGLSTEMLMRHPFPGPGLAVRILGRVTAEYLNIVRQADAIFINCLQEAGLYNTVSQAFAVFLPIKSVGVIGDGRRYDYVIALRAVETSDFMTAQWAHLSWDFLGHVSNRIINEVVGVSRVTYDISGKPPATIEWE